MANPTALLQSAVMMLRYLEERRAADLVEQAIMQCYEEAAVLTRDVGGSAGTDDFVRNLISRVKLLRKES